MATEDQFVDVEAARKAYEFLVKSGQLNLTLDRDRKLHDAFGDAEAQISSDINTEITEPAPPATSVAEENQFIDWAMDDPLEEGLIEPLDKGLRPSEKRIMATKPDAKNLGLISDFPTPKEMQAGALHWGKLSQKEDDSEKTETLIAAEEAKEAVELASAKPEPDTKEDVTTVETETKEKPEVLKTNYKDTDGYKKGKTELGHDPYAKKVEIYDTILDDLYAQLAIREDPVGDLEGSTEFFFGQEENYLSLASDIKEEIDTYEDSINAIAEEKPGEAISGANKFWAVIAAALGAGAASLTGTPNFAMQIINKTIDDHLEKFKADRDFRQKSAERQQLNLITERGRMLQMAQNAANSAAASLKDRRDIQTQIATINNIKETTRMALKKNDRDYLIAVKEASYKELENIQKGLAPNMGEKPGEFGMSILAGAGRDKVMKQVVDFNEVYFEVKRASEQAARLLKEHQAKSISPQAFSKERILLTQRMGQIKVSAAKRLYDFGAALTEIEVKLLESIIASADRMDIAFGITAEKINNFMIIMEEKREALREAGGFKTLGEATKAHINKATDKTLEELGGTARHTSD